MNNDVLRARNLLALHELQQQEIIDLEQYLNELGDA